MSLTTSSHAKNYFELPAQDRLDSNYQAPNYYFNLVELNAEYQQYYPFQKKITKAPVAEVIYQDETETQTP